MFYNSWIVTVLSALVYFYNRPIDPANSNYDLQVKYACLVQKVLLMSPIIIKVLLNIIAVQLIFRTMNEVFMNRMVSKYDGLKETMKEPPMKPSTIALRLLIASFIGVLAFLAPAVDFKFVMKIPSYTTYNPEFSEEYKEFMKTIYGPLYLKIKSFL